MSSGIFLDGMALTWGDLGLTTAKPPAHLPDPSSLVTFDMAEKKREIFEAVRERVKAKAQHTKNVSSLLDVRRSAQALSGIHLIGSW